LLQEFTRVRTHPHITGGPAVESEGTANSVDPERITAAAEKYEVFNGSTLLVPLVNVLI
jgi:hypothetical protein